MDRIGEGMQLFQIVSIDGNVLRYKAITVTGRIFDAFNLEKQEGRANLLTEPTPEVSPESSSDSRLREQSTTSSSG
jgi:hypothetical protein